MKVFGREPAAWLGLVAVIVKLVAAFGLDVSADQQAAINGIAAAAMGVLVAAFVHDGLGAAIIGLAQAALALGLGYGLDWTADRQAVVMAAVTVVVAMWDRTQVTAPIPADAVKPAVRSV
jgi:hypothetical protein